MGHLKELIETASSELSSVYHFTDTPYMDVSDKLNWQVTVNLLILLVLVLTNIGQFVSKPISCAVPIYFSENQEAYANEICYVSENKYAANESSTILIAPNQTLVYSKRPAAAATLDNNNNDATTTIKSPQQLGSYYVWVPYVLSTLILIFLLVKCLWIYMLTYRFRGLDINELVKAAARLKEFPLDQFVFFKSSRELHVNQMIFRDFNIK